MSSAMLRVTLAVLIFTLSSQISEGQVKEWCVAKEGVSDDVLQQALDRGCGQGGADCSMIQRNRPCYLPNTVKDHASYAINDFYQKYKHSSGVKCDFNGIATITHTDPSHGSCTFQSFP